VPDLMRGEETQILGVLDALEPELAGWQSKRTPSIRSRRPAASTGSPKRSVPDPDL
jgi:hypothetical protein